MELSVKDERTERIEQEIYNTCVGDALKELQLHLQQTAIACVELALRIKTGNVRECFRSEQTQAAVEALWSYPIEYIDLVSNECERMKYEITDDEQLIDRVRREVERRLDGLTQLLG